MHPWVGPAQHCSSGLCPSCIINKSFIRCMSYSISIRCIRVLGFWSLKRGCTHFFCSKVLPKSAFLQTMYLGCFWKWIWSCDQNFAPESRLASLYSVKVIKISRLTIDSFLTLWSLRCCKTDSETDCITFFVTIRWERTTPMHSKQHPKPLHF